MVREVRWPASARPEQLVLILIWPISSTDGFLRGHRDRSDGSGRADGALHGWTEGRRVMTLAVMTRASLGHTGQPLTATRPIQLIYVAALVAAVARIVVAFHVLREPMLYLSATAWVIAFTGFVIVYAPLLARRQA